MTEPSKRTGDPIHAELPLLTVPKPEQKLYRESEGDGGEYNSCLHGRKRAKLHESVPFPVLQVRAWMRLSFLSVCWPDYNLFRECR